MKESRRRIFYPPEEEEQISGLSRECSWRGERMNQYEEEESESGGKRRLDEDLLHVTKYPKQAL